MPVSAMRSSFSSVSASTSILTMYTFTNIADVNDDGIACVFPFLYKGIPYYTCIYHDHDQPWCGTNATIDADDGGGWIECGEIIYCCLTCYQLSQSY